MRGSFAVLSRLSRSFERPYVRIGRRTYSFSCFGPKEKAFIGTSRGGGTIDGYREHILKVVKMDWCYLVMPGGKARRCLKLLKQQKILSKPSGLIIGGSEKD